MVRLNDEVYERLAAHKRDDETYSEAIDRLLGGGSLLDLVGIYSEDEVDEIETVLEKKQERDRRNRREELERGE
jgi:predicted CopG family antitoxin